MNTPTLMHCVHPIEQRDMVAICHDCGRARPFRPVRHTISFVRRLCLECGQPLAVCPHDEAVPVPPDPRIAEWARQARQFKRSMVRLKIATISKTPAGRHQRLLLEELGHGKAKAEQVILALGEEPPECDVELDPDRFDDRDYFDIYLDDECLLDPSMLLGTIGTHAEQLLDATTQSDTRVGADQNPCATGVETQAAPWPTRGDTWHDEIAACQCIGWRPRVSMCQCVAHPEAPTYPKHRWCLARTPHSTDIDACIRCSIEHFATARRSLVERMTKRGPKQMWKFDPNGQFGAHYQSAEVNGLRVHASLLPARGGAPAKWACIVTEFESLTRYTYAERDDEGEATGKQIAGEKRNRDVIAYTFCVDAEEAELLAREIAEAWTLQHEALTAGITSNLGSVDYEPIVPMGAATVSPEYLDKMASAPSGRTTGARDSGE